MRFKIFNSLFSDYDLNENHQTILDIIEELQNRVEVLEKNYEGALLDIKHLEEENIGLTNELYRLENSLDARIDILVEHCRSTEDV